MCVNLSESDCNSKNYCNWKVIDNAGEDEAYCELKNTIPTCKSFMEKDSCLANEYCEWGVSGTGCQTRMKNLSVSCDYSVTDYNSNINDYVTCKFTVAISRDDVLSISWKNLYTGESGTLNINQDGFSCNAGGGVSTVNFWNSQLPSSGSYLGQTTKVDGKELVIYDFKTKFTELTSEKRACPDITATLIGGNYGVLFDATLTKEDFI